MTGAERRCKDFVGSLGETDRAPFGAPRFVTAAGIEPHSRTNRNWLMVHDFHSDGFGYRRFSQFLVLVSPQQSPAIVRGRGDILETETAVVAPAATNHGWA